MRGVVEGLVVAVCGRVCRPETSVARILEHPACTVILVVKHVVMALTDLALLGAADWNIDGGATQEDGDCGLFADLAIFAWL